MFQPGMMNTFPQPMGMQGMGMGMMQPGMMGMPMQPGFPQQDMMKMQQTRDIVPLQPAAPPAAPSLPAQATMGGTSSSGIRANVIQIAGCLDAEQGQDLDVSGLPMSVGAAKAGGACTNALNVSMFGKPYGYTYRQLMCDMQKTLQGAGYSQHPMLSSSHPVNLDTPVTILPPNSTRTKSLLIGINYTGQGGGELLGCHNDVKKMQQFITQHGYSSAIDRQQILMDDGVSPAPTKNNIWNAMKWLVNDAQPGDALFFMFSGHGGQVADVSGDEASGFDQTLIPVDHREKGIILDDDILAEIIKVLPAGVNMFCVTDCCHSGTIMDLPYSIAVDPMTGNALTTGQVNQIGANQKFHNKGARRDAQSRDIAGIGGQTAGGMAMLGGLGLCCADCFDLNGDSDQPGGNNAPGAKTGCLMFIGGCCSCCIDIFDLAGDSKPQQYRDAAAPGQA